MLRDLIIYIFLFFLPPILCYNINNDLLLLFSQGFDVGLHEVRPVRHRAALPVRPSRLAAGRKTFRRPRPHPHLHHQPGRTLRG